MAATKELVKAALTADGALMAILTGGVHTEREISRQQTPAAFDANGEILPCALVKSGTESAVGPDENASNDLADIYFYEFSGTANIDAARARTRVVLHRQKIGSAAEGVFEVRWFHEIPDQDDLALQASLAVSRYEVVRYIG